MTRCVSRSLSLCIGALQLWYALTITEPKQLIDAQLMQHKDDNRHKETGKTLGPELGFRYVESLDYVLLPFIFLFQMAFTIKPILVPFLVQSFCHNMFVVIC